MSKHMVKATVLVPVTRTCRKEVAQTPPQDMFRVCNLILSHVEVSPGPILCQSPPMPQQAF